LSSFVAAVALSLLAASGGGEAGVRPIDNPYMPLAPGSRWLYRETDTDGSVRRVVVKVTRRTKRIANGVTARVVRDTVTENGRLVEDTFDWYAQDRRGNVWYLGEDTKEYEKGKVVSTSGSWEAGVNGARAGTARVQALRPRRRPGVGARRLRRRRARGAAWFPGGPLSRASHG
jgi:hypothetical protein